MKFHAPLLCSGAPSLLREFVDDLQQDLIALAHVAHGTVLVIRVVDCTHTEAHHLHVKTALLQVCH